MTTKPRISSSASSPAHHGSKLPKFLQKQSRDRSKSVTDPTNGTGSTVSLASSSSASSSSIPPPPATPEHQSLKHRSRALKLSGVRERDEPSKFPTSGPSSFRQPFEADTSVDSMDEPPVIIEPPVIPRARTRSERPISSASDMHPSISLYASSPGSRISDLPTRLSGWFSHAFSSSSADLSLPSLLSQQAQLSGGSPKGKGNALLTAAKHGKGHLDKAMRYLLDSDSTPDKCMDPIWLLGVQHPGYEPPPPPSSMSSSTTIPARRSSGDSLARRSPSFRSIASSQTAAELSQSQPASLKHPGMHWPPVFYSDFTSRIWLTYRSQFQPIRDTALSTLDNDQQQQQQVAGSPPSKRWNWLGGEKGWTSDAGWGCMLRTGQSLLANALVHLHLGRDWRCPPYAVHTADYATYVQIVTWFFDTPSPLAPFSVHRMALAGKELGKDVGQWFGPSTAAGAIKTLVHAFPDAGLGVSLAADGVVYQSDVYAASNPHDDTHLLGSPRRRTATWGGRAVLVLVGIRLGLDGVNPVYYETIKALYTFPQSVGIAGGRPSSSYYFVGSQADNLFYLDPHHARPAVPLRPPPSSASSTRVWERETTPERQMRPEQRSPPPGKHYRVPTSPSNSTRSSTFSYHAPLSPSPLQHQVSTASSHSTGSSESSSQIYASSSASAASGAGIHGRWASVSPGLSSELDERELTGAPYTDLDPVQEHYVNAYSGSELSTFHCDRVRKMPLSGLDPSMLIGFLCKDEADWIDFRKRISDLSRTHKTIFSIQDEPPTWPSDSDDNIGLESMSDELDMDMPEDDDQGGQFFETSSPSTSPDTSVKGKGSVSTSEEDPIGPITPGPNSRTTFDIEDSHLIRKGEERDDFEDDDDDDDWVDPSLSTPISPPSSTLMQSVPLPSSTQTKDSIKKNKKNKKSAVPVVQVPTQDAQHFPFPISHDSRPSSRQSSSPESRSVSPDGQFAGRMHTARARDGGRTQSGGVKGVLTDDLDNF